MAELVSLAEAARRLTQSGDQVDRSSLSRYVKQHADALQPAQRGKETVVDIEALVRHRQSNVRRSDPKPFAGTKSRADETAEKVRVERMLRELTLAERQGSVTVVREVENAAHAAVGSIKNALALATGEVAEAIGKAFGIEPRAVRPHLRSIERRALEAFVIGLTECRAIRPPALPDHEDTERGA